MEKPINIAIEITPLLNASGTHGDKSGVYRYMMGLISALGDLYVKDKLNSNIVLFTFNRKLLTRPLSPDLMDLVNNKAFIFLNDFKEYSGEPKLGAFVNTLTSKNIFIKFFLKVINKLFGIKNIYHNARENIQFQDYVRYLNSKFKQLNIQIVFHSETGFYNIPGYKNIITVYDLTTFLLPALHRQETITLHKRKLAFARDYCNGIICISNSTRKDLLKYFPSIGDERAIVVYPGININIFDYDNAGIFNELRLYIKNDGQRLEKKKYLLYYGTFEPRKNIINLVRSFIDLQKHGDIPKNMRLVLAGDDGWGNIKTMIENYIEENYLIRNKCNIILLDFLGDKYIVSLIKNASAVVYPSLYEGFGLPVLESMTLGTPIICADSSSLPEVGGKAALYFDSKNHQDLEEKIKLLVRNSRLKKELSRMGIEQSKKFSWQKSSRQLYNFLQSLL